MSADVLLTAGGVVTATLLGALVAGWMTRKTTHSTISLQAEADRVRNREQRIWEARHSAYALILGKLKQALVKVETADDDIGELGAQGYFESAESKSQMVGIGRSWRECQEAFDLNEVIVSDEFAERFAQLKNDMGQAAAPNLIPPDQFAIERDCLRRGHPELLALARVDIGRLDSG